MTSNEKRVRKVELNRAPHQARNASQSCCGAWWYENLRGINIYCQQSTGPVLSFTIDRAVIERWLVRANACAAAAKARGKRG